MIPTSATRQVEQGILYGLVIVFPLLVFPAGSAETALHLPRIAALCLVGAFGLVLIRRKEVAWSAFVGLSLLHLLLASVSTLVYWDPEGWVFSVVGSRDRSDGLGYQLALGLTALFAYAVLRRSPEVRRTALRCFYLAGLTEAVVVILQRSGLDLLAFLTGLNVTTFPPGTLGHPGMVAGLLLPIAVLAFGELVTTAERRPLWALVTLVVVALALGMTVNRASFLALLVVIVAALLQTRTLRVAVVGAVTVALVFAASSYGPISTTNSAVTAAPGGSRTLVQTGTLRTRLEIWRVALEALPLIRGQPLIGAGPDGFRTTLIREVPIERLATFYRLEYGWPEGEEIERIVPLAAEGDPLRSRNHLFIIRKPDGTNEPRILPVTLDRAHNLFLDRALSYGVLDALVWLALILIPVWRLLRRGGESRGVSRALAWASLSLFVYYLGWFAVVQVEPLHVILLALAWATFARPAVTPAPQP